MRKIYKKLSMLLWFSLLAGSVTAQQFTLKGNVTESSTNEPLAGVNVIVKGTSIGVITDIEGNYTLSIPGTQATLVFSFIGYLTQELTVSSSTSSLNVSMDEDITSLEEVVVTGLASSVKRSNLANSIAYISSKDLAQITTQSTLDGALYGKFKGADIRASSGAPGGGLSVRLRGITAVTGSKQPLYIVDGVYMNNSTTSFGNNIVSAAAGGGNQSTNQDDASSRIADLDPEDIESVEILKGSSAAAIYGSRAGNGVVIITTKKGKEGKTEVSMSQTVGFNQAINLQGTRDWTPALVEQVFGAADRDLFNQNGNFDYENELYGNAGFLTTSRISVSGGTAKTKFFIGGTYKNEDGIVKNTGYEKYSLRANIDHQINDWIKVSLTNNFVRSQSDRSFFNNSNANTTIGYALAFTKPWENLFPDANGNFPVGSAGSNVLETVEKVVNRENINRYIGGINVTVDVMKKDNQNLQLILRGGLDHYDLRTTSIFPRELTYFQDPGSLRGVSISGTALNTDNNLAAFLVHNFFTPGNLSFRTQVGVTRQSFNYNLVRSTATGLNGSQINLGQSAVQTIAQTEILTIDKGFFVQEEVNWQDKIIATLGIRADKSSNNGDPNELFWYPKANLAVNIHNFDGVDFGDALSNIKFRIAYGQAGTFANFGNKFTNLGSSLIDGQSGLVVSGTRGNPQIGPQKNTELEFGLDLGFFNNKVGLDVTYYIRQTDDFLFSAELPQSAGFTRANTNAGDLENKGIEIGLNATPISNSTLTWRTTMNFWKNTSEVTRLAIPPSNLDGFATSLGTFRIEEGKSLTQIVGNDPVTGGLRVYGNSEADFNLSWLNNITVKDFELSFLWHWKKGGDGINLSTLLYDLANTTWDYDDTGLDPEGVLTNGDYRKNSFLSDGSPIGFVEDAGYLRLREIGLFYNLPADILGKARIKVGLTGRNLINIFDYNSYDPEVSNFGNDVLGNAVEVTPFPSSKQYNFHVRVTL